MPFAATTDELSRHLKDRHGIQLSAGRLARLRHDGFGEGPPYVRDGNRVLYPLDLADEWARARLGRPVSSAEEEETMRRELTARTRALHAQRRQLELPGMSPAA